MAKWQTTKFPGVRYREHKTRKHGVNFDRYFAVRYTFNGKRHEEALGWASEGWTPQNAAEELSRLKRAQRTGEGAYTLAERREQEEARRQVEEQKRQQAEKEATTFSKFFEDTYLPHAENHKSLQTVRTDKSYYKLWLKPFIGDKPLKDIAPLDLERVKKQMNKAGKSAKTVQHVLAIVRQVFNTAVDLEHYKGENPALRVKKPKIDNRRLRFLTYEEAEKLLAALLEKSQDLHDMAVLSLDCGPRAGEIFGLDWKDINFEQKIVTFRNTKNGIVRHIPMTDRVKEMLKARKVNSKSEIIFPARQGKRKSEVSNAFAAVINELGWNDNVKDDRQQKVVFHSLRHTCASWLVMAGVPLYTVKEYLGHQQISQTERYSHLAPDSLKQATDALNGLKMGEKIINLE